MKKIIQIWNRFGIWISGTTLIIMMLLTAMDVCGRYLFKRPITGVNDLTELMMVMIIFLALSDVASSDGHIRVEVLTAQLSLKKQQILNTITSFLSGIVAAIMAWRLGANALYVLQFPESTLVLDISKMPFIALASIGCAMLTVTLMVVSYDSLWQLLKNPDGSKIG